MLGEIGDGFKIAMTSLDSGRYSVAAGCVGICQGCVEESVKLRQGARAVRPPDRQLPARAGDDRRHEGARPTPPGCSSTAPATSRTPGKPNTTETSIAKLYATEAAVKCANTAIQVHGGAGYVDDHPVERYFRDVRVTTLYEGTSQIQKLIIGRALTGINALVPVLTWPTRADAPAPAAPR